MSVAVVVVAAGVVVVVEDVAVNNVEISNQVRLCNACSRSKSKSRKTPAKAKRNKSKRTTIIITIATIANIMLISKPMVSNSSCTAFRPTPVRKS